MENIHRVILTNTNTTLIRSNNDHEKGFLFHIDVPFNRVYKIEINTSVIDEAISLIVLKSITCYLNSMDTFTRTIIFTSYNGILESIRKR